MKQSIPVWSWIPGQPAAVVSGQFTLDEALRLGAFDYAPEYLAAPGRIALDPVALPLKRSTMRTQVLKGVFGVFADAGPDAWGKDYLYHLHGEIDEIDFLRHAPPDGAGAIVFGNQEKLDYSPPDLDSIARAVAGQDWEAVPRIARDALLPTTSLGGAKPKFTCLLDGEEWILKLPERGDSAFIAHNEHVMSLLAARCGIDACESRLYRMPDGKTGYLVKRFDRKAGERKHYASAFTVLGLGDPARDTLLRKSYVRFADALQRWCKEFALEDARALWKRLAFNALIGNADDHARNHGMIYSGKDDAWRLAPAFDMVAAPQRPGFALAMAYSPAGAVVDLDRLVAAGEYFGVSPEEAISMLCELASTIETSWRDMMREVGVAAEEMDRLASAFALAAKAKSHDFTVPPPARKRRRFGK